MISKSSGQSSAVQSGMMVYSRLYVYGCVLAERFRLTFTESARDGLGIQSGNRENGRRTTGMIGLGIHCGTPTGTVPKGTVGMSTQLGALGRTGRPNGRLGFGTHGGGCGR